MSLTTASLADVEPQDAGAASGLINVSQQLGAAVGLAFLVTIFDSATHHAGATITPASFAHGLRVVFVAGVAFTVAAVGLVAVLVRPAPRADAGDVDFDDLLDNDDVPGLELV